MSVVVGDTPRPGGHVSISDVVLAFLKKYPKFNSKFIYEDVSWPCFENNKLLVAVFRFKHSAYRIRLSKDQKFFENKKKAVFSNDGFLTYNQ